MLAAVINWTFTSGDVDVHACLFNDHRCVGCVFFACKIFAVGLHRKIILTVKFSQCLVYHWTGLNCDNLIIVNREF